MKQFLRNFRRQRVVGVLNVCCLSLGIMVSLVVGLWAVNEFTFDNFYPYPDRTYRMGLNAELNSQPINTPGSHRFQGEMAMAQLPEIERMARVLFENIDPRVGDQYYPETRSIIADTSFFDFFGFRLKAGDPATVLLAPDGVVVDETTAKKFFAGKDPIGQPIEYSGRTFHVSGIMYDMPRNSHLQAHLIFPPFGNFNKDSHDRFNTYLVLREGTDLAALEKSLTAMIIERIPPYKDLNVRVTLEPLAEIYFSHHPMGDDAVTSDRGMVTTFMLMAALILLVSCINFTNLFVSTAFIRGKTIGVMKAHGASKGALAWAFYRETAVYVLISIVVGIGLAYLALPVFNQYTGSRLTIDFTWPVLYLLLIALAVVTTLLAGSFPALQMTRFPIMETLRGKFRSKGVSPFQKGLIVLQFATSIFLVVVVLFFGRQVRFLLDQELGFNKESVVYVSQWDDAAKNFATFRAEMIQHTGIADITMQRGKLTEWNSGGVVSKEDSADELLVEQCLIAPNYFEFFEMPLVSGENSLLLENPDGYCVINQQMAKLLGFGNDAVGKSIHESNSNRNYTVTGVVRNAQTRSLHAEVDPQFYYKDDYNRNPSVKQIYFRLTGDPRQGLAAIERKWKETVADQPFSYHFLDDDYRAFYSSEMSTRRVLGYALIITLLITAAGLFAMAYYSAQRRIKEIGIRKINGATVGNLLVLLNREVVWGVAVSFVIACPVAYFFLGHWLEGFVARTPLSWWVFALAGLAACVVALLTVTFQTWKTASANPIDSLRSE